MLLWLIDDVLCKEGAGVDVSLGDGVSTKVSDWMADVESIVWIVECGIWGAEQEFNFARLEDGE